MPLAVNLVDDLVLYILPNSVSLIEKQLLSRYLVGIIKTHDAFGLCPPVFVGIDHYTFGIALIEKAAVLVKSFLVYGPGHGEGEFPRAFNQHRVTQHFSGFQNQPTALNIVTERNVIGEGVPLVVEEHLKVTGGVI